ncbi:DUF2339 domain-containing protein [Flavobacterium gilvum]|uniref:DUF2339 domain-containing protein n=1 Tax=Flavobacterium gilvum TaxID=1492737 RepID=A0AAC9I7Q0_9FLAO|nr:DUF2339 domain-containing protein [Flavobacterium gilvum]AOW09482.1 hypothetical protein EM308_08205 [Flavobacterium gilvum]KFC60839.1 membrane protein [Flavobacterium gilvum]
MEIFLLLGVFIFLFVILNTIKQRFDKIEFDIFSLNQKLELLKKTEKPVEKVFEKEIEKIIPPIISTVKEEEQKPIEPVPVEKPIEKIAEKSIFAMDTDSNPKPISPTFEPKEKVIFEPEKTFWENFKEKNPDLEKFIGENLINKIGILILVLGISYFVKYAIDKNWINEPARVGIGILSGALVMGIAHKLRKNYAAFSSVIVAGAIAIFYFTIGIAFHDYHLFNQSFAFGIMVVITAFSALISLSYNRVELAVLSLIGGFAVPFMVSTGEGNYVVLFSYITILNIGILSLAYFKKWNLVNILSYIFTIILYGAWLIKEMHTDKPHYLGGLLFGFGFYFIFILMNIINNIRTKGEFSNTQLTILASNTFLFYGAGMVILNNYHPEFKGLFTTSIALLNLVYAWFLYKKFGLDKKAVYLVIGLTLTFVTLAIPIQFEGNYITLFWAAEAVLLMWLSQKSKVTGYRFGSVIVHFLMLISLLLDWEKFYKGETVLNIILNPIFTTGVFTIVSLFLVIHLLKKETEEITLNGINFDPKQYSKYIYVLATIISYLVGLFEVIYQSNNYLQNINSARAIQAIYHLLFFAALSTYLMKRKTDTNNKGVMIIAVANIILYTICFSNFAFKEHFAIIRLELATPIAFYLHYISLALTFYFGYQLYLLNNEKLIFNYIDKKKILWIAAFLIVYICSSEVMIHGLQILDSPLTAQTIQASPQYTDYKLDLPVLKEIISSEIIQSTRTKIIKTSFPILWGVLAFVFLIIGIKKQVKTIRIIALSLLGLTIVKLFLYDISNISETGKIISFILLGILILIISFVYQKIKILVIDETKPSITDEIQ